MAPTKQETPTDTDLAEEPEGEIEQLPDFELEKRILRKFDFYVLLQFMIMVLIAYLDRSNIGIQYCPASKMGLN